MEIENIVQNQTHLIQLSIHGIVVLFLPDVPLVPTHPMCELLYPEVLQVIGEEQSNSEADAQCEVAFDFEILRMTPPIKWKVPKVTLRVIFLGVLNTCHKDYKYKGKEVR